MAITGKCNHKCAGGRDCTCDGLIRHAHHICRTADCACHQAEAYGLEMVTDAREAVYVPIGAVLVAAHREADRA